MWFNYYCLSHMISYHVWISQNFVTKHKLNKVHMENTPGKDIVGFVKKKNVNVCLSIG